jgi:putative transposase
MDRIKLPKNEVEYLLEFTRKGRRSSRELTRARVLLSTHEGKTENTIKEVLGICRATICNIKKRYREEGLESALKDKPRPGQPKKYNDRHEAEVIAFACTKPPPGRKKWSLVLLAEELKKTEGLEMINRESIRLILKKARQNPS